MINDFVKGARFALAGLSLARTRGIRRYVLIPLLINIVLFTVGIYLAFGQAGAGIAMLVEWLPDWLDWLSWLLWMLFAALMLIVAFYTFTVVANLIGSPFNSLLSEKLEEKLTGNMPPSSGRLIETLRGISGAVISEFRKFGYLLAWAIPLVILSIVFIFLPPLSLLTPIMWFIFGAWMLALEYLDYPMGNHGFTFNEQRAVAKQKRRLMLGFGSVIMIMTMIPILNFLAMPVAVAGITQLWVKEFSESALQIKK
ncbi:MAG: sulfate transporter CysZ [Gammaproteobacteria bacterium]|nr:sulfate transporter CysZ [Gammaproteobacteria bacterium]